MFLSLRYAGWFKMDALSAFVLALTAVVIGYR
jgi:hypothetical protein